MSVWYMAHPLTPDEHFSYEQNMEHVLEKLRWFLDQDIHVIAPYHTHCLVLDNNNPDHSRLGLEVDVKVVKSLKRLILVGHKISRGMKMEFDAASNVGGLVINLTGRKKEHVLKTLDYYKEQQLL